MKNITRLWSLSWTPLNIPSFDIAFRLLRLLILLFVQLRKLIKVDDVRSKILLHSEVIVFLGSLSSCRKLKPSASKNDT